MFYKNDRVMTPQGPGTVAYKMMAAPTFHEVQSYSVKLDHKVKESELPPFPHYSGTMFHASDVKELV